MNPPEINAAPHSAEAELGVLSSMLTGGAGVIEDVRAVLRPDAFYVAAHKKFFVYIGATHDQGQPLDLITFTQTLRDEGVLEELGGAPAATQLFTFVPTAANVDHYVEIVREKWMLREIIMKCTTAVRRALDQSNDPKAVLDEVQSDVIEIGQLSSTAEALRPIADSVPEVVASIEATYRNRGKPIGLPTGFVDLDRMCGGFQAPKTYYIGARPAMGKSSLATEFAEHVAIDNASRKVPVAIFSVEMTAHELTEVILCRRAQVNLVRLRDGFFTDESRQALDEQAEIVKRAEIYIDDTANLSIFEFRARARRAVLKFGVRLIVIDYIQRMKSTSKRSQGNREQEINEIAMGISETAKELKVPIVVLAQLNRKNEERQDKTPELSDFRESGSLEQEAHLVGLLHRPSYYCRNMAVARQQARKYGINDVPEENDTEKDDANASWLEEFRQLTQLIIAKQRRGPVGPIRLRFVKEYAAFESEDPDRPLFSNTAAKRQGAEETAPAPPPPPPVAAQAALDIFPGSRVVGDDEPNL